MILHTPPGSPAVVGVAAAAILTLHIGGGVTGILSGATALLAPKGGPTHRAAGHVFFVSMLIMSGIGTLVSPFLPQWSNVGPGAFTFYLVATAWMTVRRPEGQVGRFEVGALVLAWSAAAMGVGLGLVAARSPKGLEGYSPMFFFIFASLPALAGALDLGVIRRGGVSGARRIARHLWRMSVALFVAAGSLFLGQPKVFPHWLRGSPIMFAPEIAILALMIFWLVRLRAPKAAKTEVMMGPSANTIQVDSPGW
ncbi:MAG TPA: hypothetical protein VKQ54_05230 [Caulobacteraceae bacterium]|nr:hypothetical protein [Caulobacteraceae bacterium]